MADLGFWFGDGLENQVGEFKKNKVRDGVGGGRVIEPPCTLLDPPLLGFIKGSRWRGIGVLDP